MIDIIPAIDLIGGKCVRLVKGDYGQTKDNQIESYDVYIFCLCKKPW